MVKVMISCGEASGDLYAGALVPELRRLQPDVQVFGLGGQYMRRAGAHLVEDYRGLTVTGLIEALTVIPRSLRVYRSLVAEARAERPDVFVAIDFPDFNLRLAETLNRLDVPVIYYVGPQVWAWRASRLRTIKRLVKRALVIFAFEEAIYREAGIPVEFVGHPLVDLARSNEPRQKFLEHLGFDPSSPTVALLPGSRPNEVRAILPDLARAASMIASRVPQVQFLVARAPNLDEDLFHSLAILERKGFSPAVMVEACTDDVLASADVVLTASGTATVQSAIHECPMIIVYRLSPLTYRLAKHFVQVEAIGMINLVAGEKIVPELIQDAFTAEAVSSQAVSFLTDQRRSERTRQALRSARTKLGSPGASLRAAQSILSIAKS